MIKESFKTDLLYDLFQAYYDTRRNKRSSINALSFEIDYESKLFQLYEEIKNREYEISRSIGFIIFNPVQREIFASDFRDRIVHHLIYNYINPIFERRFINDCCNCRTGKGTSYGVKRLAHFIRSCSRNYTRDCYILKLDIGGYFMSIDRSLLYKMVEGTLNRFRKNVNFDMDLILYLIRKAVFNDPVKDCVIKGSKNDWNELPKSKSLFFAGKNKGFPIGNLTSQLFGNVYLNEFDHFVKYRLGLKYYGRYVDDLVIIHSDKEYLRSIIPLLREYLQDKLLLKLHPKKIYLQHYSKGVNFLGTVVKPYRIYIGNRTKGNFYQRIQYWNNFISERQFKLTADDIKRFLSSMNSYLGIMSNCKTYKLRKKMLKEDLSAHFWKYVYISAGRHKNLAIKIRKERVNQKISEYFNLAAFIQQ